MNSKAKPVTAVKDRGTTTQRVAEAAHEAIDGAAHKAAEVEAQIRTQGSKAAGNLEAAQEATIKELEQSVERLEKFVKQRPVAATGLAFAAGVLATMLLRR